MQSESKTEQAVDKEIEKIKELLSTREGHQLYAALRCTRTIWVYLITYAKDLFEEKLPDEPVDYLIRLARETGEVARQESDRNLQAEGLNPGQLGARTADVIIPALANLESRHRDKLMCQSLKTKEDVEAALTRFELSWAGNQIRTADKQAYMLGGNLASSFAEKALWSLMHQFVKETKDRLCVWYLSSSCKLSADSYGRPDSPAEVVVFGPDFWQRRFGSRKNAQQACAHLAKAAPGKRPAIVIVDRLENAFDTSKSDVLGPKKLLSELAKPLSHLLGCVTIASTREPLEVEAVPRVQVLKATSLGPGVFVGDNVVVRSDGYGQIEEILEKERYDYILGDEFDGVFNC